MAGHFHYNRETGPYWMSFAGLRFETVVDLHLISGDEPIRFVRHANHGHQLFELRIGHAFVYRRRGVRSDAVFALVRYRNGDIDHFFGERIERSGSHDLLDFFPSALEHDRIMRDRLPEIIDPVGFARGHDVVVDGAHFGAGVVVFDKAKDRHAVLREKRFRCQISGVRKNRGGSPLFLKPDTCDLRPAALTIPSLELCSTPRLTGETTASRCKAPV